MAAIDLSQWPRMSRLLDELLDADESSRTQRLATIGDQDSALATQLARLLARQSQVDTVQFLEGTALTAADHASLAGRVVGNYTIERMLGAGGMGGVWLAQRNDGRYQGRAAVKFLNLAMLGQGGEERFRREGIALARLSHPNIAQLIDAGTDRGQPYLILEYIEGEPIDHWCDARSLTVTERIGLVREVIAAVVHAHERLILHRDLKPSNILVTAEGRIKLLDFGVAKLLDDPRTAMAVRSDAQRTARVFTPDYASPEQVRGDEVTTATDVYTLGVLLHQLLVGEHPTARDFSPLEHLQAVIEREPPRTSEVARHASADSAALRRTTPARLARELRGDLDNIVAKALKKNPGERYLTAAAFGDDLRRYLKHEPVEARADSAAYRMGRFIRRNRSVVAPVALALAAGLLIAAWQLRVARTEKQRAEDVSEFVASIFRSADPYFTGGRQVTAAQLLTLAKERIDGGMASRPEAVQLLVIVGEAQVNLEEYAAARATLQAALDLAARTLPADSLHASQALAQLAAVHVYERQFDLAKRELDAAIPTLRSHGPRGVRALVKALMARGFIAGDERDTEHAIADMREAVAIAGAALGENDSETIFATRQLAQEYLMAGRGAESIAAARDAFERAHANFAAGGHNALLVETEDMYGRALTESGQSRAGIRHLQNAVARSEELLGLNNQSVASKLTWLARAQMKLGDLEGAIESMTRCVSTYTNDVERARASVSLGVALIQARRLDEAVAVLRSAVADVKRLDTGEASWLPHATATYGTALALAGMTKEARHVLQQSLDSGTLAGPALAETHNGLGLTALNSKDPSTALQHFRRALETAGPADPPARIRAAALFGAGVSQLELGRLREADETLAQAEAAYRKVHQMPTPALAEVLAARDRLAKAQESTVLRAD